MIYKYEKYTSAFLRAIMTKCITRISKLFFLIRYELISLTSERNILILLKETTSPLLNTTVVQLLFEVFCSPWPNCVNLNELFQIRILICVTQRLKSIINSFIPTQLSEKTISSNSPDPRDVPFVGFPHPSNAFLFGLARVVFCA